MIGSVSRSLRVVSRSGLMDDPICSRGEDPPDDLAPTHARG